MTPSDNVLESPSSDPLPWWFRPAALLGFAAAYLFWDGVIFRGFGTHLRGWPSDNLVFAWNIWWVGGLKWLSMGSLGAPPIFQPDGTSLYFHSHSILAGLISAPFRVLGGAWPIAAHNCIQVASTALAGLAGLEIARAAGVRGRLPALAAGLTVAFSGPRLFAAYGHLNLFQAEFLLFSMLFSFKASFAVAGGRRYWLLAGLFSGLCWLNESTYGIYSYFFWGAALLRRVVVDRSWRAAGEAFWFPAASFLVCGWLLVQLALVLASGSYFVASPGSPRTCDLLNFFLPTDYHRYLGVASWQLRGTLGIGGGEGVAFIGFGGLLALAAGAVRAACARKWPGPAMSFWMIVGAAASVLSLGEWLTLAGQRVLPLPGIVLPHLPIVNNLRVPERFMIFAAPAIGCLVGRLLDGGWRTNGPARLAFWAAWIILFSASIPLNRIHCDVSTAPLRLPPPVIEALRGHSHLSPPPLVMTIPFSFSDAEELWHQTQHHLPVTGGYVARLNPKVPTRRFESYPVLWMLRDGEEHPTESFDRVWGGLRNYLRTEGVGFVILRKDRWSEGTKLFEASRGEAILVHEEEWLAVYRVPAPAARG